VSDNGNLDIPVLERPAFFDGQQLTAADLAAVQAYHRELLWLHNRGLHNWGIAFGYAVEGKRGGTSVHVGTGYALDCRGRDLILDVEQELPVPAVAGAAGGGPQVYLLTASYADDDELEAETRAGICDTSGAVRRVEAPVLRWQDPADTTPANRYRRGIDVVLASVKVAGCALAEDASGAERRDAIPATQPYVFAGRTTAGETPWTLWPEADPVGVATTVTTTEAGFQATPRYFAHVVGERIAQTPRRLVVDGYAQVAAAGAGGFELRVILPSGATPDEERQYTLQPNDLRKVLAALSHDDPTTIDVVLAVNNLSLSGLSLAVGRQLLVPTDIIPHTATFDDAVFFQVDFGRLASRFSTTVEAIIVANHGLSIAFVGQTLLIPQKLHLVTVEATHLDVALAGVASAFGTTLDRIKAANGFNDASLSLSVGQVLQIPAPPLDFNPRDVVLTSEFLATLEQELDWHVVWLGVEG
jgi:LysM domain